MQDEIPQNEQNIKDSPIRSKTTLFARKIPYDATDSEFEAFFSEIGPLRLCFTVKETKSSDPTLDDSLQKDSMLNTDSSQHYIDEKGQNRGFGFVQYVLSEDAERALKELKKVKFRGQRTLKLEFALKKHEKPPMIEKKTDKKLNNAKKPKVEKTEKKRSRQYEMTNRKLVIEKDVTKKNSVKNKNHTLSEDAVLFIRNISFEVTEEELSDIFRPFGPLRYCVITRDDTTGRSRGTGFVCFVYKKHADACLEEAKSVNHIGSGSTEQPESSTNEKKRKGIIYKSVLTADPSDSQALKFTLHGRVLSIVKAVDRDEAHRLTEENKNKKQKEDRRNTYLIKEGGMY
ncbi:9142_t:CDS:2 [Dentiscutata erythropus]|uniref:9142_t:CDS:1 n=1 Tax=Dentiscutata erythropus TaxID=1348616 RepID=A0A9N9JI63_9GLOM|nr:9142_t:CDS:2 [Dentiscutata erythropus]